LFGVNSAWAADLKVSENTTLSKDTTVDALTVEEGVTLDLAGYSLTCSSLAGSGTIINDLYSTMDGCPEEYYTDHVHPRTKEGIALAGNKVLSVICGELGISATDVNIENFTPEDYSKDNIGY
jgi:hypothetical protein